MNYFVKDEDTLQRISAKAYGDWTVYSLIQDFNQVREIFEGQVIVIPEINLEDEFHVITEKDSYESLSLNYYGSEHFSGRIWEANSEIILEENIGLEIIIPTLVDDFKYKKRVL